ncbi:hypothetical protein ACQKEF_00750 [Pseudomonas oryzihabitans]|uniref:hypothetical protein n=1 Tax=Pseudomonas oryzihabitans TaxID=47885 RepID=UPI00289FF19F|nr:hypothetical protein [Pseudomonas oryzihabitans]
MAKREDLDHKPENAGKVGETHKELNQGGEEQRPQDSKRPEQPKENPDPGY